MVSIERIAHVPALRPLNWWLGELRATFALFQSAPTDTLVIDARLASDRQAQIGVRGFEGEELAKVVRRARRVVLHLDPGLVLRRTVQLPLAAEQNIRQVLEYEIDHLTPFKTPDVYFDFRLLKRDTQRKQLDIDLVVAPRRRIDELLTRLRDSGGEPELVGIATETTEPQFSLLPRQRRRAHLSVRIVNRVLGVAALILLGVVVALPLVQKARLVAELEPQLEQARNQALSMRQLQDEIERLRTESRFVVRKRAAEGRALDILNETTRLLPDDTWLYEFNVKDRVVQMRGEAPAAARLVGLVEASDLFANARLPSPVTQATEAKYERFHLATDLTLRGTL